MLLAIDIGNTNLVIGCIENDKILFKARIATDAIRTSDQYGVEIKNMMEAFGVKDIDDCIISSVVPPVFNSVKTGVIKVIRKQPMVVGPGLKTGLNIHMDVPSQVGSDRIVIAVAALAERLPRSESETGTPFPAPVTRHEAFVEHPGAVQSSIRIGRMLFPRQHPDFLGMQVVASALGGYFGSRLMQNLREERGYTYGVVAAMVNFEQAGYFAVATQVGTDVTRDALREIYAEIERLRTEPMPDEELSLVKNIMIGEMMRILDGPFGIADVTIENILCGRDHTVIGENIRRIQAMTPADIQRLAQKYLAREDLVTVIAGDPIPEERQAPEEKADRQ